MREMKDSGIEWIKEIPVSWNVLRGKNILNIHKRGYSDNCEVVTCFRDGQVTLRSNRREEGFTFADKEIGYQGVKTGDLVIHGMDGFAGAIGISDSDGKVSPVLNVCTPQQNYNTKFLMYYLRMLATQNVFIALATGIRERSCDLRWNKIAELLFPITTKIEQTAIANYLDDKCGKIDVTIQGEKQHIEKLKEYRQAVITEAVTKGLDPTVPMKDSGIEWIGEVPQGWRISKIKFEFDNLDALRKPINANDRGDISGKYDYYGASGVIDKIDQYIFNETLLLIGEDGANLVMRNLPLVYKAMGKYWVNNHSHILRPTNNNILEYWFFQLECVDLFHYITGSAQPKLTQGNIGAIPVAVPSLPEQTTIADYLDHKTAQIDSAIAKKETLIEKLTEYKKSLIYEAVTGKMEVY